MARKIHWDEMSCDERKRFEDKIRLNEDTIASQSRRITELESQVTLLSMETQILALRGTLGSQLNKMLTLDFIISMIEHRRTYANCNQLIDLLKSSKLMRIATDAEVAKIDQIEQEMLDASVPMIRNDIKDSQVFLAPVQNPTFQLPTGFTEEMMKEAIDQYQKRKDDGNRE